MGRPVHDLTIVFFYLLEMRFLLLFIVE